jgi:hypothetical protein
LALLGGGVALLASRAEPAPVSHSSAPAPATVEPSANVEIGVEVTPAGVPGLSVTIGDEAAPAAAPERLVRRSNQPLLVKVSAPGFVAAELKVIPDRDRVLGVTLTPEARAAAASAKRAPAAATPAPRPSGVIRRYPF